MFYLQTPNFESASFNILWFLNFRYSFWSIEIGIFIIHSGKVFPLLGFLKTSSLKKKNIQFISRMNLNSGNGTVETLVKGSPLACRTPVPFKPWLQRPCEVLCLATWLRQCLHSPSALPFFLKAFGPNQCCLIWYQWRPRLFLWQLVVLLRSTPHKVLLFTSGQIGSLKRLKGRKINTRLWSQTEIEARI